VIIMLSTIKGLLPILRFKEDHPQAVFIHPEEGNMINLTTSDYLDGIKKIEGLDVENFMKKAINSETEFAYKEGDDDKA